MLAGLGAVALVGLGATRLLDNDSSSEPVEAGPALPADDTPAAPTSAASEVGTAELTSTRWIVFGYQEVAVGTDVGIPFVEFGADGSLHANTGCQVITGTWALDGDRLITSDLTFLPDQDRCTEQSFQPLLGVLNSSPTLSRATSDDDLALTTTDTFVHLRPFDDPAATVDQLIGTWYLEDIPLTFDPQGRITIDDCDAGTWALQGERLDFAWAIDEELDACLDLDTVEITISLERSRPIVRGPNLILNGHDWIVTLLADEYRLDEPGEPTAEEETARSGG